MKIVSETQYEMVIKEGVMINLIVGAIFASVGFLAIVKPDIFTERTPLWADIVGILLGILIIFLAKSRSVCLSKDSNKLLIVSKSIFSRSVKEYPLNRIKSLIMRQVRSDRRSAYQLVFVLDDNSEVAVNLQTTSISIMGVRKSIEVTVGSKISSFLGIPFGDVGYSPKLAADSRENQTIGS